MKKILALLVSLVMVFAFVAACGGDEPETAPAPTEAPATEEPVSEEPVDEEPVVEEPVDEEPVEEPAGSFIEAPKTDNLVYWGLDDLLELAEVQGGTTGKIILAGTPYVYERTDGPGVTVSGRTESWGEGLDVLLEGLEDGDYVLAARMSASEPQKFSIVDADGPYSELVLSSGETATATLTYGFTVVDGMSDQQNRFRMRIEGAPNDDYNIEAVAIFKAEPGTVYDAALDFVGFGSGNVADMPGCDWPAYEGNYPPDGAGRLCLAGTPFVYANSDSPGISVTNRVNDYDALDVTVGGLADGKYKIIAEVSAMYEGAEIDFWIQYGDQDGDGNWNFRLVEDVTGESATLEGEFDVEGGLAGHDLSQNRFRINATPGEIFKIDSIVIIKIG